MTRVLYVARLVRDVLLFCVWAPALLCLLIPMFIYDGVDWLRSERVSWFTRRAVCFVLSLLGLFVCFYLMRGAWQ